MRPVLDSLRRRIRPRLDSLHRLVQPGLDSLRRQFGQMRGPRAEEMHEQLLEQARRLREQAERLEERARAMEDRIERRGEVPPPRAPPPPDAPMEPERDTTETSDPSSSPFFLNQLQAIIDGHKVIDGTVSLRGDGYFWVRGPQAVYAFAAELFDGGHRVGTFRGTTLDVSVEGHDVSLRSKADQSIYMEEGAPIYAARIPLSELEGEIATAGVGPNTESLPDRLQGPTATVREREPGDSRFVLERLRATVDGQVTVDGDLSLRGDGYIWVRGSDAVYVFAAEPFGEAKQVGRFRGTTLTVTIEGYEVMLRSKADRPIFEFEGAPVYADRIPVDELETSVGDAGAGGRLATLSDRFGEMY